MSADTTRISGFGCRTLRTLTVATAVLATVVTAAAQGASPAGPEAFGAALKSWAAKHGAQHAFIAVRHGGKIVHRSAVGGADSNAPVHLASLSKAITGACVATLIRDGKLAFDTPLSVSLAKFFAAHGRPVDGQLLNVTVAQLLTHRAGFSGNPDNADLVTGPQLVAYLKTNSAKEPPKPALLAAAFKSPLLHRPGLDYSYSNTGYLTLGAIIEEAAGKPYLTYCHDAVLAPLGVTGDFDPDWKVMGAYGGWRLSADAYLAFLDLFAAADTRLGRVAKAWMLSPEGKITSRDGQVWYGLGTNVRKAGDGVNVWHWGSWRFNMTGAKDGTLRSSFVTFAVRLNEGTGWFVQATPQVAEGPPRAELDRTLWDVFRAVKKWE
jgi:CubicO group peptidase (beta-lactamase class C family)